MKVLLINPPSSNQIRGAHPLRVEDMGIFPHLGLMYIAAVLMQDNEFEVRLLDSIVESYSVEDLIKHAAEFRPSVTGITSYSDCLCDIKLIASGLRKELPDSLICIGGPHVDVYPDEALKALQADCIIKGDGEYSFRELCRCIRDKKPWNDIRGIGYLDADNAILNDPWQAESLDDIPFPARELSSMEKMRSAVSRGGSITSVCSSRGCPFPCTFCSNPYKKYRFRSAENIAGEIAFCREKYGINEFFFFDDLFNLSKERMLELCARFSELPFDFKWSFRGRVSTFDEEALRRCREVGCNRIHFGIEAGTPRIQKIYRKDLTLGHVRKIFGLCRSLGIETVANFIIGAPTETREEIETTLKFAFELKPDFVEFHVLIIYPYTEIYIDMLRNGTIDRDVWREFALDPAPGFSPPASPGTLPPDELHRIMNSAYRRFYFRPSFILRQLFRLRNPMDFFIRAAEAFRLFFATRDRPGGIKNER